MKTISPLVWVIGLIALGVLRVTTHEGSRVYGIGLREGLGD